MLFVCILRTLTAIAVNCMFDNSLRVFFGVVSRA